MSPGSNHIWPIIVLLGVAAVAGASAFSPLDPACAGVLLPSSQRCSSATFVDEFEVLDEAIWVSESHFIGRRWLDAGNATHAHGRVHLTLPAGTHEGSEIRSRRRGLFRTAAARIRTPDAPGALVGFFLYQGVRGPNDEIDIEIFGGERRIMFTTWSNGESTNHAKHELPFDPSSGFHDYRIEWERDRVAFFVDDVLFQEFVTGIPQKPMFLMSNAWWPQWLEGPTSDEPLSLEIEHLAF